MDFGCQMSVVFHYFTPWEIFGSPCTMLKSCSLQTGDQCVRKCSLPTGEVPRWWGTSSWTQSWGMGPGRRAPAIWLAQVWVGSPLHHRGLLLGKGAAVILFRVLLNCSAWCSVLILALLHQQWWVRMARSQSQTWLQGSQHLWTQWDLPLIKCSWDCTGSVLFLPKAGLLAGWKHLFQNRKRASKPLYAVEQISCTAPFFKCLI